MTPTPAFASVDDYERLLHDTLRAWPPARRVVCAAAMAERWLPAYRAFATAERWGDPAVLVRALDAVWAHAAGTPLTANDLRTQEAAVDVVTPHMDDFDAYEALAAATAVTCALRACLTPDDVSAAEQAAVSGFHGVEPAWEMDPDAQGRLWKRAAVQSELRRQLAVLERVAALPALDAASLGVLRASLSDRAVAGRVPKPVRPAELPGHPNALLFDIHRRRMESSLKRPGRVFATGVEAMIYGEWLVRYSLRLQALSGQNGRFADTAAQAALAERNRARDAAVTTLPAWPAAIRERVDLLYRNPYNPGLEVRTLDAPHAYGPSLRALWAEAKRAGASDDAAWQHILAWAHHRPAAWTRRGGRCTAARLDRAIAWRATRDLDVPWAADVDGARWTVRLNDFPDDVMYTLLVDGRDAGTFHDWPARWTRD